MRFFTLTIFSFLLAAFSVQAQDNTFNTTVLGEWSQDTLPDAGTLSYNEVWGYTDCNGREYGIFGSSAYVHFLDVTDPENVTEIASFAGGSTTIWRDFKTYKDHAYAVCDNCGEGMMVFDLSQLPDTVIMTEQSTEVFTSSHNIFVDEQVGRLYSVGTNTNGAGVHIYDLTEDPGQPVLLSEPVLPGGYMHDINVVNNIAFASSGQNGLYVYDFTDPDNFEVLGTLTEYPEKGYNHSSWPTLAQDYLVMADETHDRGLKMVEIADLTDMTVVDVFRSELLAPEATGSIPHNPFIRGNYIFVSYYHDGMQVFDMSNPSEVTQVAWFDSEPDNTNYNGYSGTWGVYPFLPSGTILCSDIHRGFYTVSLDSIDLELVTPTLYPENVNIASSTNYICPESAALLTAGGNAETYTWTFNNEIILDVNADTLIAENAGTYSVTAQNAHCATVSADTVLLQNLTTSITISSEDNFLCGQNHEVFLSAPVGGTNYAWLQNGVVIANTAEADFFVSEAGNYAVTVENGDCSLLSSEIEITGTIDMTDIITADPPVICIDSASTLSLNTDFTDGTWFYNGEAISDIYTPNLMVMEAGNYSFGHAFTENCFLTSNSITVNMAEPLVYDTETFTTDSSVIFTFIGAQDITSYQWSYVADNIETLISEEDGGTSSSFEALTSTNNYFLEVTDLNGCITRIDYGPAYSSSTENELYDSSIYLSPNPFNGNLKIEIQEPLGQIEWRVFDILGRLVEQSKGNAIINTNKWENGFYLVSFYNDNQKVCTRKVIKQ